jgi:hypothetical protein
MRFVLLILFFFTFDAVAQIRPLQTTRMTSTSGAGVGSLLVVESAILNPAALAFFTDTYFSYQKNSSSIKSGNDLRLVDDNNFPSSNGHEAYFLFDNSSQVKGGFSYQHQREGGFERKRLTASLAGFITDRLTWGLLYKYTEDNLSSSARGNSKVSHPVTLGLTYVFSPGLIVGATYDDPGLAIKEETRANIGIQYSLFDQFVLIFDAGTKPNGDAFDSRIWRGALQFNVFSDFFVRAGKYQDRALNLEGDSWGVSWIGPKLGAEFAMKQSTQIIKQVDYLYPEETITDISFAFHLKF